jgi:amino acid transporter
MSSNSLKQGKLGVAAIVFYVISASAALVGMTGAVPVAMLLGNGAAVPGTYLLAGLVLLLFSVGYTAMSHKVTNAGAFFAYVGKGLGLKFGVSAALISLVAYITIQLAVYAFLGALLSGQLSALGIVIPWWVLTGIALVLTTSLSLLQVDVGAKILGVFIVLEILALFITSVAILFNGGPEGWNLGASFSPENIFAGGITGFAGIALAFAFASFVGFEATAIYGEESVNPKKTVRRATYWAISIITGIFTLASFAMVTGMGASQIPDQVINRSQIDGVPLVDPAAVLFSLASEYVGPWMASTMNILVLLSLFAGLLALQNSLSRYFFALGRGGVFPEQFAKTNKFGAPQNGVIVTSTISIIVIALSVVAQLDPILNLFYWTSAIAVIAILLVEILVSVAVVAYFRNNTGANFWQGKVAPALAAILLIGAEYLLMSRFNLLAGTVAEGVDPSLPESSWALSPLGWLFVLIPFIVGLVGFIVASIQKKENKQLTNDMLS